MAYLRDPYVLGTMRRLIGRMIVLAPRQEWVPTSVNVRLFLTMWMVTCYPEKVFESMEDPVAQAVLPAEAGRQERLVFVGDDESGRALEVMANHEIGAKSGAEELG